MSKRTARVAPAELPVESAPEAEAAEADAAEADAPTFTTNAPAAEVAPEISELKGAAIDHTTNVLGDSIPNPTPIAAASPASGPIDADKTRPSSSSSPPPSPSSSAANAAAKANKKTHRVPSVEVHEAIDVHTAVEEVTTAAAAAAADNGSKRHSIAKDRLQDHQKKKNSKHPKAIEEEDRNLMHLPGAKPDIALALCYVNDAMAGRLANGSGKMYFKPRVIQQLFIVQTSPWWTHFVYLAAVVFSVVAFFIPPSASTTPLWAPIVEMICICVFIADVIMKSRYMGKKQYLSKQWHKGQIFLITVYLIDWILGLCGVVRVLLVFRPAILLGRQRDLRKVFNIILMMLPRLVELYMALFWFLCFFGLIGLHIFADTYSARNADKMEESLWVGSFDNIGIAFTRLFVLFTTENYPMFMEPAYADSEYSFVYFFVFLYLGVFFLNSIVLALIVNIYLEYADKQVLSERKKEWKGLLKSFTLLDKDETGIIKPQRWTEFMKALRPHASPSEIKFYFDLMDRDKCGAIDAFDFLDMREILQLRMHPFHETMLATGPLRRKAQQIVHWRHFDNVVHYLNIANFVLALVWWTGMPADLVMAETIAHFCFATIFVAEIMLRSMAVGAADYLDNNYNLADLVTILGSWGLLLVAVCGVESELLTLVANLLLALRTWWITPQMKLVVLLFKRIAPVMLYMTTFILIVMYMYAVVGMQIFHGFKSEPEYEYFGPYGCPDTGFSTLGCALMGLFQVLLQTNWQEAMAAVIHTVGYPAAVFFITYCVSVNLTLLDLLIATTIEAFLSAKRQLAGMDIDDVQQALVELSGDFYGHEASQMDAEMAAHEAALPHDAPKNKKHHGIRNSHDTTGVEAQDGTRTSDGAVAAATTSRLLSSTDVIEEEEEEATEEAMTERRRKKTLINETDMDDLRAETRAQLEELERNADHDQSIFAHLRRRSSFLEALRAQAAENGQVVFSASPAGAAAGQGSAVNRWRKVAAAAMSDHSIGDEMTGTGTGTGGAKSWSKLVYDAHIQEQQRKRKHMKGFMQRLRGLTRRASTALWGTSSNESIKEDRPSIFRVTRIRGPWRRELSGAHDAMSLMTKKDLDKLSKLAKTELHSKFSAKEKRREERQRIVARHSSQKDEEKAGQHRALSRISPILQWYTEALMLDEADGNDGHLAAVDEGAKSEEGFASSAASTVETEAAGVVGDNSSVDAATAAAADNVTRESQDSVSGMSSPHHKPINSLQTTAQFARPLQRSRASLIMVVSKANPVSRRSSFTAASHMSSDSSEDEGEHSKHEEDGEHRSTRLKRRGSSFWKKSTSGESRAPARTASDSIVVSTSGAPAAKVDDKRRPRFGSVSRKKAYDKRRTSFPEIKGSKSAAPASAAATNVSTV